MKLHEYQAKRLLAAQGIPIPDGDIAETVEQAREIAARLGGSVLVKAQVLAGGRGKAGGIVVADTVEQAAKAAERILGSRLKGLFVPYVLVERKVDILDEIYVGLTVDRNARRMALILSTEGGVDIEETAQANPASIHRIPVDPLIGLRPYHITRIAGDMGLPRSLWGEFYALAHALYVVAEQNDATLAEVNPLVISSEHDLWAVDAKMIIDDSALCRHPHLVSMVASEPEGPEAREADLGYVKMDGDIGCMVNGAGLAMATMDVIDLYGGAPANFLDIGGGAGTEPVVEALNIILADVDVSAVLINIFGGITRCDRVAQGIIRGLEQLTTTVPLIIRLAGTNENEGRRILEEAGIETTATLDESARLAVAAARGIS